jgi:hypothetical protein
MAVQATVAMAPTIRKVYGQKCRRRATTENILVSSFEQVTQKRRLGWNALQQARHLYGRPFA